jgi:hypothetical protein
MPNSKWQFSTRSLLLLTAVVSIILAVAVRLPDFFRIVLLSAAPVLVLIAIFQSANFATSDRRPLLASLSWALFAAFFGAFAFAIAYANLPLERPEDVLGPIIPFGIMAGCCLVAARRAYRSCRLLRGENVDHNDSD